MNAVCHRCGGGKIGPFATCNACGFTPDEQDRATAWLFSAHHLDGDELIEAAHRIQAGEPPDPSRSLVSRAREQVGVAPLPDDAREPFPMRTLLALATMNLALTPLAGLAVWAGYRTERPIAARQALRLTLPLAMTLALIWLWVVLHSALS